MQRLCYSIKQGSSLIQKLKEASQDDHITSDAENLMHS